MSSAWSRDDEPAPVYAPILPRGTALVQTPHKPIGRPALMAHQYYPDHPLSAARLSRGLTVYGLADALGVHPTTLCGWVSGACRPRPDNALAMARLFRLDEATISSWFDRAA
jgi:DNA-binding XRE family transcriptional regulator